MMSNTGPRYKRSSLEVRMNWDVGWCVVILVLLCFFGALGSGLWVESYGSAENVRNVPFLTFPFQDLGTKPNSPVIAIVSFFSYIIVLQSMIPLSLYVSLEIIKLGQIFFISRDKELYHEATNSKIECRALNIPEELGQIEYILSDKTGTLTENQMIFRRCAIQGVDYGPDLLQDRPEAQVDTQNSLTSVKTYPAIFTPNKDLQKALKSLSYSDSQHDEQELSGRHIHDFFVNLAVCNTVVVPQQKHKDLLQPSGSEIFGSQQNLNGSLPTGLTTLDASGLSEKNSVLYNPDPSKTSRNIQPEEPTTSSSEEFTDDRDLTQLTSSSHKGYPLTVRACIYARFFPAIFGG